MEVERRTLNLKATRFERENERAEKYTLADELPTKLAGLSLRIPAVLKEKVKPGYTIRILAEDDEAAVLDFLRKTFFLDEPLNDAVELLPTPDSRCVALEEYATSSLDDGVSLAAVDSDGKIVGVMLNGLARREDAADAAKACECSDAGFARIMRVLAHLDERARVWERVRGDRLLEIRIASTRADWRGRGLMKRLCEETEDLARRFGCGAIRMDATSAFSAAAAERLRYSLVYSIPYVDIPGAPVVPEHPHVAASVYIKTL